MRDGVPACGRHGDGCQGNEGPLSDWGEWKKYEVRNKIKLVGIHRNSYNG